MAKFWIIVKQVYKRRVKTKSFLLFLLFPLLIFLLINFIPQIFSSFDSGDKPTKIALLTNDPAYRNAFQQDKKHFRFNEKITSTQAAKQALKQDRIDGFITFQDPQKPVYYSNETAGKSVLQQINQHLTSTKIAIEAKQYKLSQQDLQKILAPVSVDNKLQGNNQLTSSQKEKMSVAVLLLTLIIFLFVISYTNIVSSEIATEKGTRIMEVILSSVSATTHLLAKLTAIILMILTQLGFYLLCIALFIGFGKDIPMLAGFLDQFNGFPSHYLFLNIAFIIFGLLLYIILAALIGSLVPNVETVAQFIYPITILCMVGYWGSIAAAEIPDNLLVVIGSYIPVFSPMMMLARMDLLAASNLDIWLSLGILIVTIALALWLTIKLYRHNLLLYSQDGLWKTWRNSWKYAKMNTRKER